MQGGRQTDAQLRFHVMDGLRGLAALAVVVVHSLQGIVRVSNGQLAVDLFFILSGFVIGFSYDNKMASGMPPRDFLKRRFIRLYPMLWMGAVGGVLIALTHNLMSPDRALPIDSILIAGGLSLLVLPYFGRGFVDTSVFPLNAPMWSLFYEVCANIVYAVLFRWLTVPVLFSLTLGGVLAVALNGPLGGFDQSDFGSGMGRVTSGFFGGLLMFRLWRADRLPRIRGNLPVLAAAALAVLFFPFIAGGWSYVPFFAALWLVVLAAANARPSRWDKVSKLLGEASYPMYLLHTLTLYVTEFAGKLFGLDHWTTIGLHLLVIPFIGYGFYRFYEQPTMIWLRRAIMPST